MANWESLKFSLPQLIQKMYKRNWVKPLWICKASDCSFRILNICSALEDIEAGIFWKRQQELIGEIVLLLYRKC